LENIWQPPFFGSKTEIYNHAFYQHYCYFPKWDFNRETPVVGDSKEDEYNIKYWFDNYIGFLFEMYNSYRTNNLLITCGCDFTFMNAEQEFTNYDKLIQFAQDHPEYGINLFYSTPG